VVADPAVTAPQMGDDGRLHVPPDGSATLPDLVRAVERGRGAGPVGTAPPAGPATVAEAVAAYEQHFGNGGEAAAFLHQAQLDAAILQARGIDAGELPTLIRDLAADPRVQALDELVRNINGITHPDPAQAAHQRVDKINELRDARTQLATMAADDLIHLGEHPTGTRDWNADSQTASGRLTEVKSVRAPITRAEALTDQLADGIAAFNDSPAGDYHLVIYAVWAPQLLTDQWMPGTGSARWRIDATAMTHTEVPDGDGGWRETRAPRDFFQPVLTQLRNMARRGRPAGARRATEVVIRMDNGVTRTFRRDDNNVWSVVP
jgi:hypothetical protein